MYLYEAVAIIMGRDMMLFAGMNTNEPLVMLILFLFFTLPTISTSFTQQQVQSTFATTKIKPRKTISCTQLSMCQLMGMNCAALTDFTFSFRGFAMRGGNTDVHSHGWGLCFYDGRGLRAFHDSDPASDSLLADFLQQNPVKTLNMVSREYVL